MDFTLFSSDQEEMILVDVEVEAHTTCKSIDKGFLFAIRKSLAFINNKLKLDNFFSFKLVFQALQSSVDGLAFLDFYFGHMFVFGFESIFGPERAFILKVLEGYVKRAF